MKRVATAIALALVMQNCLAATEVTKAAQNSGIKSCLEQLRGVSDFVIGKSDHGTNSVWNTAQPNKRLFETFSVKKYSDAYSQIIMTASPNSAGKCDLSSNETMVMRGSCMKIRETTFKDWKYIGSILNTAVIENTNKVSVFLTPQLDDSVCLVNRQEVSYEK
ncbi:hypothetical protein ACYCAX_19215 [Pseudomonas sp. MT3]|uniref:hypothetical protein n=1 Tax=Pseudomonas sp. ATCC 13867 TaxID=1294143 RepID=UPI0002C4ECAE|nr:hypothetical protein [Pseudomonas sp. ATCC 13867]AGI23143.1 hypothetical protein H681_06315 [Pseudomonas sp. ATCC 13867]RFQ37079.1 hypothetical protein D0N87_07960 [Pseudomonas sp. ATCC 13867]